MTEEIVVNGPHFEPAKCRKREALREDDDGENAGNSLFGELVSDRRGSGAHPFNGSVGPIGECVVLKGECDQIRKMNAEG